MNRRRITLFAALVAGLSPMLAVAADESIKVSVAQMPVLADPPTPEPRAIEALPTRIAAKELRSAAPARG